MAGSTWAGGGPSSPRARSRRRTGEGCSETDGTTKRALVLLRILVKAVESGFCGLLEGPAATGKTECIKELARHLGTQVSHSFLPPVSTCRQLSAR